MGKKTDKKVKSDRINVLRKQYEAFLEEDKKRKDRNEYILGRLETMRYNSTAVQLHPSPKTKTYGDYFPASNNRHAYRPETVERNDMQMVHMNQQMTRPDYHSLQLEVPRNYIEETTILQEISKKYILIPKLRHTFPNDPLGATEAIPPIIPAPVPLANPKDIDNSDWKSKYDILEQLKKKENEEQITKYGDHFNKNGPTRKHLDRASDNDLVKLDNYKREDLPASFEEEIPEKDISDHLPIEKELSSLEKCQITEKVEQLTEIDAGHGTRNLSLSPENAAFHDETQNKEYDQHGVVSGNVEHISQHEKYVIPAEQNVVAVSYNDNIVDYQENYPQQEFQPEQKYPIEYEQFIPNTEANSKHADLESANQEENDYSPIEVINPNELVNEIHKGNIVQEAMEAEHEYPAEIANTQEFTPDETVTLQDPSGINPENNMTDDGTIVQGNPVPQILTDDSITKGIEEFDAENKEMFYSEESAANYAYEQGEGQEYNAEYAQNQNYPETQDYAYYQGAEQTETYPVEINEHEETALPYDQHYEQQYAPNYEDGYEQQTVYMEQDPTQPQYEQPVLYDQAHQEFEQVVYDQEPAETPEQVEQALDQADGYVETRANSEAASEQEKLTEQNVP